MGFRRLRQALLLRLLAGLLAVTAFPGFEELVEDLVHYLSDGHTAHDPGHEDEQEGHCCSGLFHTCSCCPHAPGVAGSTGNPRILALSTTAPARFGRADEQILRASGHRSALFRPPTV